MLIQTLEQINASQIINITRDHNGKFNSVFYKLSYEMQRKILKIFTHHWGCAEIDVNPFYIPLINHNLPFIKIGFIMNYAYKNFDIYYITSDDFKLYILTIPIIVIQRNGGKQPLIEFGRSDSRIERSLHNKNYLSQHIENVNNIFNLIMGT